MKTREQREQEMARFVAFMIDQFMSADYLEKLAEAFRESLDPEIYSSDKRSESCQEK